MTRHSTHYRVYYEDTDALGIMYHANYIKFCERGRSELLRHIDLPASTTLETIGVQFVIRHMDAHYLGMAKLDNLLNVETCVKSMKNSSFVMTQTITRDTDTLFSMDITIVCLDKSQKPIKIPDILKQKFMEYI